MTLAQLQDYTFNTRYARWAPESPRAACVAWIEHKGAQSGRGPEEAVLHVHLDGGMRARLCLAAAVAQEAVKEARAAGMTEDEIDEVLVARAADDDPAHADPDDPKWSGKWSQLFGEAG